MGHFQRVGVFVLKHISYWLLSKGLNARVYRSLVAFKGLVGLCQEFSFLFFFPNTALWDFYSEQHASVHFFIHSLRVLYITVTFKYVCLTSLLSIIIQIHIITISTS